MSDNGTRIADQIKQLIDARRTTPAPAPTSTIASAPMPGFRFGIGADVLELVGGERGVVRAAYYGAAVGRQVYEINIPGRGYVVRLEAELELARGRAPAPPIAPVT